MFSRVLHRRPSAAVVISILSLFVALSGWGYAAIGGTFILGKSNSADATSFLTSSSTTGPALALTSTGGRTAAKFSTSSSVPPFSVTSSAKVANLHADLLHGKSASDFLPSSAPASITGPG